MHQSPLAVAAVLTMLVWLALAAMIVLRIPVSRGDPRRVVPVLLALAAFLPTCVAAFRGVDLRGPSLGASANVSRGLNALLLVGIALLMLRVAVNQLRATASNAVLVALLLAYWVAEMVSDLANGLHPGALSFYVLPFALVAALMFFPSPSAVLRTVLWTGFAVCAMSLGWAAIDAKHAFFLPTRNLGHFEVNRLAGVVSHPNTLGYVAGISLICAFSIGLRRRTQLLVAMVCGGALVLSESRGSWLGIALVCAMALGAGGFGLAKARRLVPAYAVLVATCLGGVLALLFGPHSASLASASGRAPIWRFALNQWRDSPLLGIGPHAWGHLIATGAVPASVGQAHNQFLESLLTLGVVGLALLLAIFACWLLAATRAISATGEWVHIYLLLFVLVTSLFEAPLVLGGIDPRTWFLVCAIAALRPASVLVASPVSARLTRVGVAST